jgi:DNA-directed RNA polymerase subunit RPC12/RpoP
MNKKQVWLLIGGAGLILLAVVLLWYEYSGEDVPTASAIGENRCRDCGRELPKLSGGVCPFCKLERVAKGLPAEKPASSTWSGTDFFIVGMILFLFGGGGYLITRSMKRVLPRRVRSGPMYLYRCPWCKRKIRYGEKQAGREGVCPHCRHATILPDI